MVGSQNSTTLAASFDDPLLPWLWSIKKALEDSSSRNDFGPDLTKLLFDCITKFKGDEQYRNDARFLKIWLLYIGLCEDFDSVFREMMEKEICVLQSSLYVWYAVFLESKGKLQDAHVVYHLGIRRNAEPLEWLKKAQVLFLDRMLVIKNACSAKEVLKLVLGT